MSAKLITIDETKEGQRVDNFLLTYLKGVPKTRVYKAIRKGEVRVNKGRIKSCYRLQLGDEVRIPPLSVSESSLDVDANKLLALRLSDRIAFENDDFIILNKLAGVPVHGGTKVSAGVIESLRFLRPELKFLELVHRLDKGTSGCLLIAKKRKALLAFHELLTQRQLKKQYLLLVQGEFPKGDTTVDVPLTKNQLKSGERMVVVDQEMGKAAKTRFQLVKQYQDAALVSAWPITGRTHQIRVHAAHLGHPLAGDDKYGDREFNREMRKRGLTYLFLHAASLKFRLPESDQMFEICVPMGADLLVSLRKSASE